MIYLTSLHRELVHHGANMSCVSCCSFQRPLVVACLPGSPEKPSSPPERLEWEDAPLPTPRWFGDVAPNTLTPAQNDADKHKKSFPPWHRKWDRKTTTYQIVVQSKSATFLQNFRSTEKRYVTFLNKPVTSLRVISHDFNGLTDSFKH